MSQNERYTNTCLYNLCLSLTYAQNPTHIHIVHLGRERDTSPPCPVGLSFCPGLSVFSPTMPAHLWSTGPLPGSSASSCGCAAHLCSLQHNRQDKNRWKNIFSIVLSVKILWSLREHQHQRPPQDGCTSKQKKPPAFVEQQRGGLECIRFESKCVYSPSHRFVTSCHRKPST